MKLLVLCCIIGFAAADFMQDAAPVIQKSTRAFLQGARDAGSLIQALGIDDPDIQQLAEDLEKDLGEKVRESLKDLLEKIRDQVDNGKAVGRELLQKVKELRKQLQELGGSDNERLRELLKKVRDKAKEALRQILERLGFGKRNLDDSMDQVARLKFRDLIDRIKEKILSSENIKQIRQYIKSRNGKSPILKHLQDLVSSLDDNDLRGLIRDLFDSDRRLVQSGETWDRVKGFFKDLNLKINDKTRRFGEWVRGMWGKGLEKLKEKHGAIKAIALEFIANAKDMSAEMSKEALEFFRPYKDDLGSVWNKLVDATKEAVGRF